MKNNSARSSKQVNSVQAHFLHEQRINATLWDPDSWSMSGCIFIGLVLLLKERTKEAKLERVADSLQQFLFETTEGKRKMFTIFFLFTFLSPYVVIIL